MASLLDTNVVSQQTKPRPHEGAVRWWRQQRQQDLYMSVVSLAEIRFGIDTMDAGRKQRDVRHWLENDLASHFRDRLLSVSSEIADKAGGLIAFAKKQKLKLELADALIAATALVHGLQVATLNRKHFAKLGVELVDL